MRKKTYALYYGDKFLDLGSMAYLANKFNISIATMRFYMSPIHRKRSNDESYIVIVIEED